MYNFEVEYLDGLIHVHTINPIVGETLSLSEAFKRCIARLAMLEVVLEAGKEGLSFVSSISIIR